MQGAGALFPMLRAGDILILTGTPGSGKTTVARALAALPGSAKVHLHSDDFWHFIRAGAIPPYLPAAHSQNGTVMNAIASAADAYASGGFFVIVDGIVGPWFLDSFRSICAPLHYVVLRPALEAAIERCRLRGSNALSDPQPIASLHHQFDDLGDLAHHAIETDTLSREDVQDKVLRAVEAGTFLLPSRSPRPAP